MNKKCIIIFSGFNQRAIIAFIRTLELHQIDYAIIAKSNDDSILSTNYIHRVLAIRESVPLILDDIINSIKKVKKVLFADEYIIAPSAEALNRFLLKNRKTLEIYNITIPLISESLYELISDKYSFGLLCRRENINQPEEFFELDKIAIPFVAKPKKYFSSDGNIYNPFLILSEEDKTQFLNNNNANDFFYQEFIKGKSLYLLYYFHRDGTIFKYSQENIVQQPEGKSIIAAVSSDIHLSIESGKYERLLKKIDYFGFIMIEIRKAKASNYMIEANPRLWGPSQLFVDAGNDFFNAFLHDYGFLDKPPNFKPSINKIKYFWFGGLLESYKNNNQPVFHNNNDSEFYSILDLWINSDIYKRTDTINIFKNEIKQLWIK